MGIIGRFLARKGSNHERKSCPKSMAPRTSTSSPMRSCAQLAKEIRDELVRVLSIRPAHFASNLGVVELCLALHLTFDFSQGSAHLGHRAIRFIRTSWSRAASAASATFAPRAG